MKRQTRTAVSTTPREFHPCSFKAALPNACDALNARTMAIREYRPALYVVAHKLLPLFCGVVVVALLFPVGEKCHGVPAVWLGTDGMCPLAVYAAPPLSCGLSLSKNNRLVGLQKHIKNDMLLRNDK